MIKLSKNAGALFVLTGIFFILLLIFVVSYFINASKWVSYPANRHIFSSGRLTHAGSVYDLDGEPLASTVGGERLYANTKATRKAVLHAVGDSEGFIATGIQSVYKTTLAGYNILDGAFKYGNTQKGGNMTLTLKSKVCEAALSALGDKKGAVGVYNYKTGEILCMVSSPSFDPENKPDINDSEQYGGVYINRLLSSAYTPGSVFKIITAAASLENSEDISNRTFNCSGTVELDGGTVTCPKAHGEMTFSQAFGRSCNTVFASLAAELGGGKLTKTANTLGFNKKLRLDDIPAVKSTVDLTSATESELGWAGIGQYTTTANPYQMMFAMGTIANGGVPVTPYIVHEIKASFGLTLHSGSVKTQAKILPEDVCLNLQKIMRDAVVNNYGESGFSGLTVCGKTGTAEVGGGKMPHAWFVGYTLDENLPLAFAVIAENSGAGSDTAIPVIKKVLKAIV